MEQSKDEQQQDATKDSVSGVPPDPTPDQRKRGQHQEHIEGNTEEAKQLASPLSKAGPGQCPLHAVGHRHSSSSAPA